MPELIPRSVYFALEDAARRMRYNAETTQFTMSDAKVGMMQAAEIENWLKDKKPKT